MKISINKGVMTTALALVGAGMAMQAQTIVTKLPDNAEVKYYTRSAKVFYSSGGTVYRDTEEGTLAEIAFTPEGEVYLLNPISRFKTGSYIQGVKSGNTITFRLPQAVRFSSGNYYYTARYRYDSNGEKAYYYLDEDSQTITFTEDEDGVISMEACGSHEEANDAPDMIMGFRLTSLNYDSWTGYGDYDVKYIPFEQEKLTEAGSAELQGTWVMESDNNAPMFVKAARDGDDFYLGGVHKAVPDGLAKGTIKDGVLTIPSGQFIGVDEENQNFVYFMGGEVKVEYNEALQLDVEKLYLKDDLKFTYDEATETWKGDGLLVVNASKDTPYFLITYYNPVLRYQSPDVKYGKPQAPEIVDGYAFNGSYGYLGFDMSLLDENGSMMDPERLYYRIYMEEDLFTFYQDEYPNIDTDGLTEIPYLHNDSYLMGGDTRHYTYFFLYGLRDMSVQSVYRAANGDVLESELVKHDFMNTAVDDLDAASEPVSVKYFSLTGVETAEPGHGIYVKVETYADGTTSSKKVFVK